MSFDAKLKALNIELPMAPKPVANYVPVVRAGDLLFLSGVLPSRDGQLILTGKLGQGITIEQRMEAAKVAALNALARPTRHEQRHPPPPDLPPPGGGTFAAAINCATLTPPLSQREREIKVASLIRATPYPSPASGGRNSRVASLI